MDGSWNYMHTSLGNQDIQPYVHLYIKKSAYVRSEAQVLVMQQISGVITAKQYFNQKPMKSA